MREIRESGDENEVRRGGFEVLLPVALFFQKMKKKIKRELFWVLIGGETVESFVREETPKVLLKINLFFLQFYY
jgi:hypothetical protein